MPSPGRSALEMLTRDPSEKEPWTADKFLPIGLAIFGFGMACYINWGSRKPVFSGIQKHIALTLAGGAGGWYWEKSRRDFHNERDAILRHYVELHPELFPTKDRYKIGEIIEPWIPIR